MTALADAPYSFAYHAQQRAMVVLSALVQRSVRRFALGERERLSSAQLTALRGRFAALLQRDLENVKAGIYPRSLLFGMPWLDYARRLPRLALDVPAILARMKRGGWRELPPDVDASAYPAYYRRTFHWQTDGYLSRRSAELYDVGVEFLFGGTADIMRRQVIAPIVEVARSQSRPLQVLDVACGTGRTLAQIHRALPDARLTAVDLSPFYLQLARETLGRDPQARFVPTNAESLPFPDNSFDAAVSVFLFHELPRASRRKVWAEMARVVRPGGRVVVLDSVQRSDAEDLAYFVDRFSREMHEPFYREYTGDDLAAGMAESGLTIHAVEPAYLAKLVVASPRAAIAP
ncbi:MAG TPA: class I SAM-dependent methyltransferase [Nannocystaceae bacterium]|nr:class I SAM-dependent methyltransferase [Nannocystaceae bacterium]